MTQTQRTVDSIQEDFALATTDERRAELILEMDAVNNEIAQAHRASGDVTAYQSATGHTRQAQRGKGSEAFQRTQARMRRGTV